MSTRLFITALLTVSLAIAAGAQEQPTAQTVAIEGAAPTESTVSRDRDTLSVDFPDEDIRTILRNVADLFELNLVVPDTLVGKTSIKLRDVTWRQIFQVVLSPVGYSFIEEGNIIKVVSNDSLLAEPTTTEVIIVNNAKAADIMPTISVLIDAAAGGRIVVDARSNALVVTERPSRMSRIRQTIEQLDHATEQVMIETKFVEVTDRDVRNIGVNWASLQGFQVGVGSIEQAFSRNRSRDSSTGGDTTGSTSNSNTASSGTDSTTQSGTTGPNVSSNATTTPSQTTANTTTTTTTTGIPAVATTTTTTGLPTSNSSTQTITGSTASTNAGTTGSTSLQNLTNTAINSLAALTDTGGTSRLASAVFSASDFNIILSALKTQNNSKVVSNPTVVTLNNTEAFLNIGSEFPIPNYTYNAEQGRFEVSGFNYKPIGVILKVTPQVNRQGLIRLNLEPEISQQADSTTFGGAGGAQIPIVSTRKVKTQVSLQNGYTVGIGGLLTSSRSHGGNKVPLLGDIPGIGRLFSSKSTTDTVTNLLIFLTAKTVNSDGAAPADVFSRDSMEAIGMGAMESGQK